MTVQKRTTQHQAGHGPSLSAAPGLNEKRKSLNLHPLNQHHRYPCMVLIPLLRISLTSCGHKIPDKVAPTDMEPWSRKGTELIPGIHTADRITAFLKEPHSRLARFISLRRRNIFCANLARVNFHSPGARLTRRVQRIENFIVLCNMQSHEDSISRSFRSNTARMS